MSRFRAALLSLTLGALVIATIAFSTPAVSLRLAPLVSMQGAVIKGYLVIEPNAHNRSVCVVWSSDEYATQSCRDIDGADEMRSRPLVMTGLPGGVYAVSAVLYHDDGKLVQSNVVELHIISQTGAPDGGRSESYRVRGTR